MFRLPVSGRQIVLRPATGAEDLLLLESADAEGEAAATGTALALAARLAVAADGAGGAIDWAGLCVTDLDALLLRVRQAALGDRILGDVACPAPGCGRRVDVSFGVDQYLAHHAPDRPAGDTDGETIGGWHRLRGTGVSFRPPTAADQLAVAGRPDPERELLRRCTRIDPAGDSPAGAPPRGGGGAGDLPAKLRRRVESAMQALAPSLSHDLHGRCPECGGAVTVYFDARRFVLRELRQRAAFVYQDVDLLARRYHWSEAAILALPHARRSVYVELAGSHGPPPPAAPQDRRRDWQESLA